MQQLIKNKIMKRYLLILVILNFMFSVNAESPLWNKVTSYEKQSLPKSALEVVDQIYKEALKTGNSPELIKTIIYQLKFETAIDSDKLPDRMKEIEEFANKDINKVEQAVLYSLLADLYTNYYNYKSRFTQKQTALTNYVPEDIREWPANIFIKKISDLVDLSLIPEKELQSTPALDYKEILTQGNSSRNLRPTLYDFLVQEAINTLASLNYNYQTQNYFPQTKLFNTEYFTPASNFTKIEIRPNEYDFTPKILKLYQNLLTFRLNRDKKQALLITDLDRLDFLKDNWQGEPLETYYLDALETLKKEYASSDFVVEVLYREASYYLNSGYALEKDSSNKYVEKAYYICKEGIKNFPSYERIGLLKNLLDQITHSELYVDADNVVYPGNDLTLKINYKNFNQLTIEIYRIDAPITIYSNNWDRKGQYNKKGTVIKKETINLINKLPYISSDTTITIPISTLGNYEYVIRTDKSKNEIANQQFSVSRLVSVSRTVNDQREFLVVDRISGEPMEGAKVNLYTRNNNNLSLSKTIETDKLGLAHETENNELTFYNISFGDDKYSILSPTPWISTYNQTQSQNANLALFTDRSIYRPGQTVYFKGIAFISNANEQKVVSNKNYTLTLRDANYKEIATLKVTSNEFGSFSGEFTIPTGLLTGNYSIQSNEDGASASFQVEEYKRPTFDIYFNKNDKTYSFGDKIDISGYAKTFSGINLQDADVRYRITRSNHWLYRGYFNAPVQVGEGTVQTKDDGSFNITFIAEKAYADKKNDNTFYIYTIETIITNTNGETQNSTTSVNIGDRSMYLSIISLSDILKKENIQPIVINGLNLNGNKITVNGSFDIYQLTQKDKNKLDNDNDNWIIGDLVYSGKFNSNDSIELKSLIKKPSGKYRIIAKAKDQKEREVEVEKDFILASDKDKKPPIATYKWIMTPKTVCKVGEDAEIILGSSAKNVFVLYELFKDKQKLSATRFILNNENKSIKIPFLDSYEDGITATFSFVKDSKFFTETIEIRKEKPDKSLNLTMEVFRDRLLPGQKEEWKISVKDIDNNPALAEILAGMYDASLDKIYAHSWRFNPLFSAYLWKISNRTGNEFSTSRNWVSVSNRTVDVPSFNFDSFNWFGFNIQNQMIMLSSQTGKLRGSASPSAKQYVSEEAGIEIADLEDHKVIVQQEKADMMENSAIDESAIVAGGGKTDEEVKVRQNFNETAFFYPHLKTNEKGETLISFTVPESNTTWKFMALAHTKDLKYAQIIKEAISQKKLMVSPNVPRFIREGDKMSITSNISNLSEENISGSVSIELFDPNSNKINILVNNSSKEFALEPGKTSAVSWDFEVPYGIEMTTFKIIAKSANYSDGEQHLIPVLPNRMMVTESLPLTIVGRETKEFTFDKMINNTSSSLENYRLTLEFAGNPSWYAIQALPAISQPQTEDILSWFAAYYSNSLATHIANSTPKIKQIINIWTKTGGTKETLISNLEKNQELKSILIEETPWVMEAKDESEQKQRLALLFDLNRSENLNSQALDKLKSLQLTDGGWEWFKGMGSNVSITQWILYGLGELSQMKALSNPEDVKSIQELAVNFIDREFKKNFEAFKKNNKNWKNHKSISTYELEYLYVRSFYQDIPLKESGEASKFYTAIAEKYWTNNTNLYDRAIAAIVLQRSGKTTAAKSIIASLREHATNSPELGMYWANNNTQAFMSQSATAVHTFIMEAFNEVGASTKEMDELKLWLLKQKQTQLWENVPATVNAINILIKTGGNWLENEGKFDIKLGSHIIYTNTAEAGTGYIKEVYEAKSIKPDMANVVISKSDDGPAWGALYWQYFEDLDKITNAKTGLNVEKALYVEKVNSTGKTLVTVSEGNPLKVGDKVTVRLTIRSDRDMEFVQLKDMRASCFEPVNQLSGTQWQQGLIYYQAPKDASMNFYISMLPKGTYVLEYSLYVTNTGDYSNGITTIQCMYAPEFTSHTSGERVIVE